ncbi:MAG: hypothetical protein MJZ20_06905 [Bacteroidaceae bacterium]|nr:hypothetical protein [Bacteroidaceae bacterium]
MAWKICDSIAVLYGQFYNTKKGTYAGKEYAYKLVDEVKLVAPGAELSITRMPRMKVVRIEYVSALPKVVTKKVVVDASGTVSIEPCRFTL